MKTALALLIAIPASLAWALLGATPASAGTISCSGVPAGYVAVRMYPGYCAGGVIGQQLQVPASGVVSCSGVPAGFVAVRTVPGACATGTINSILGQELQPV